eukprot:780203-Rhodomonas_salina.2
MIVLVALADCTPGTGYPGTRGLEEVQFLARTSILNLNNDIPVTNRPDCAMLKKPPYLLHRLSGRSKDPDFSSSNAQELCKSYAKARPWAVREQNTPHGVYTPHNSENAS